MRLKLAKLFLLLCLCSVCLGCPRNESNTVTVVLEGNATLNAQIAEHLATSLLDDENWFHISWWQWGYRTTHLKLSPVVDAESLRERIKFGTVTRIEGRQVYVRSHWLQGSAMVVAARARSVVLQVLGLNTDAI